MADENKIIANLSFEQIKELISAVSSANLGKLTVETENSKLVIEGKKENITVSASVPAVQIVQNVQNIPAPAEEKQTDEKPEEIKGNIVKSPVVGTFYNSPAPGKAPFVKVGQSVKKGDILMIIESMKVMNEIPSEFDGTVAKVLVESGSAVEYDQPVMIIN